MVKGTQSTTKVKPVKSEIGNVHEISSKHLHDDFFYNREHGLTNLNEIKNILSKVPNNCFFEFEFVITDAVRNRLKLFRNPNTNEILGDIVDVLFPKDNTNGILKIVAHAVKGMKNEIGMKQLKVLNREWQLPMKNQATTLSVDFYDFVYQYSSSNKYVKMNKYFNLSEFFKVWMDNVYILDAQGNIVSTRMRYLRDFAVPTVRVYQYYPVAGTDIISESNYFNRESDMKNVLSNVRTPYEDRFNFFTTTLDGVTDGKKALTTTANRILIQVIQKTFKYLFAYGAAALDLGGFAASYGYRIAGNQEYDNEYLKDILEDLTKKFIDFFTQDASSTDSSIVEVFRKVSKSKDIDDLNENIMKMMSDEKILTYFESKRNDPAVQAIIESSFKNLDIKHGILNDDAWNTSISNLEGIKLLLKSLQHNDDILASLDAETRKKVKGTIDALSREFDRLNDMEDGDENSVFSDLRTNSSGTGSPGYVETRLENIRKIFGQAFNREQKNAYNTIFSPFHYDLESGVLQWDKNGNLGTTSSTNIFPHQKKGNSNVRDAYNSVSDRAMKGIQILALGLSAYVFAFSAMDLAKMIVSEPVINKDWKESIKISKLPSMNKFTYTKFFYEYMTLAMKPNPEWFASGRISRLDDSFWFEYDEFVNSSDDKETINSDGMFSTATKKSTVKPIKMFTFYNFWPVRLTLPDLTFEEGNQKSKFTVEFAYTWMDEN